MPSPRHPMKMLLIAASGVAGSVAHAGPVTVRWNDLGVPHVRARNFHDLGFGYGHAVARDRLCQIVDHVRTVRGERSRWFGEKGPAVVGFLPATNIASDLFYRVQLADDAVDRGVSALKRDARDLARGYAAGINAHVAKEQALCDGKPVPVLTERDIVRIQLSIAQTAKAFHVAPMAVASTQGEPGDLATLLPPQARTLSAFEELRKGIGSNAWAYGRDVTGGDGAMLVANPHSSWGNHWLTMHQVRLTIPGRYDVSGAAFLGLPIVTSGFNRDVAWSILQASTVTTLALHHIDVGGPADRRTWRSDGTDHPVERRPVAIETLNDDGTVSTRRFTVPYAGGGAIYRLPAIPGRPGGWYRPTDAGDGNARGLNQFLELSRTRNVRAFRRAVETGRGLGSHLLAADRHGEVAYVEAGPMLDLPTATLERCRRGDASPFLILDGSRGACAVADATGTPRLAENAIFPTILTTGILQNVNNSFRHSPVAQPVAGDYPLFDAPARPYANLRLPMSQRRMAEIGADGIVTPDEALSVVFDNRAFAAERWLPDIMNVCAGAMTEPVRRGCAILSAWDRRYGRDSRGAVLFHQLWKEMIRIPGLMPVPDPADPLALGPLSLTPDRRGAVLAALGKGMADLAALGIAPDAAWGQVMAVETTGGRIALHGGPIDQGVLNVLEGGPLVAGGFSSVMMGSAYLQAVRWQKGKLVAEALLAHGQTARPDDPGRIAQLRMFGNGRLASADRAITSTGSTQPILRLDPRR